MPIPERRVTRNAVVQAQTGKTWDEWFGVLDTWNTRDHSVTAGRLQARYHLSAWWTQAIIVRYAWERGQQSR